MSLSEINLDNFNYIVIGSSFGAQPLLKFYLQKREQNLIS